VSTSDNVFLVANPVAARNSAALPRVEAKLIKAGVPFTLFRTAQRGQAEERTRLALQDGYTTIAAVGGDGTFSEVARGFFENATAANNRGVTPRPINREASLALLPAGTGNDFARGMLGFVAPFDDWVTRLVEYSVSPRDKKTTRGVDVLYASVSGGSKTFICINAATLGIGATVATRVSSHSSLVRLLPGRMRFAMAAIAALQSWKNRLVHITVDGESIGQIPTNLIAISNGSYVGGGMQIAPSARTDDGWLDIVAACGVSRLGAIREFTRIYRGGHFANPKALSKRGRQIVVEGVTSEDQLPIEGDGDVQGSTPATFSIIPGALGLVW
jgi:diacylglycerol kinase family enzyme